MTIELCSNILQTVVACGAGMVVTIAALRHKTVGLTLVAGMLDTFALGILYWMSYQLITAQTPQVFYVADIAWLASLLFLLALERYLTTPEVKGKRHVLVYLPFPIGLALALYFCQWGDVLLNIAYMAVLSFCVSFALRNLLFGGAHSRRVHFFCIVFALTEIGLWLASCFWVSDGWSNPYFWFDFALSAQLALFYPFVRKAVAE